MAVAKHPRLELWTAVRRIPVLVLLSLSCVSDTTRFVSDPDAAGALNPGRASTGAASPLDAGPGPAVVASSSPDDATDGGSPTNGKVRDAAAAPDAGPAHDCARFLPIPLPAGFSDSTDTHLSGDGLLVVANGAVNVAYAHRWQQSNSMLVLSPLDGDTSSWVTALNRDASVIVGGSFGPSGSRAVRWGLDGTPTPLAELSDALAVSADGSIVLGRDANGFVRWTASGSEPITSLSTVNDMSADGRSLVGTAIADAAVADRAALDAGEGAVSMSLPEELTSRATRISKDGQVVVGTSIDNNAVVRVFRWQAGTSEQLEGMLEPYDINADGSVIVGAASSDPCSAGAAIWRQGRGVENLGCLLPAQLVPEQWQLTRITSVSDDGRVFSGSGINPDHVLQSWVAVLGDACPAP